MSNLVDLSDAERGRYVALVGVLGDPATTTEGQLCVLLARWLAPSEVDVLVSMMRRQLGAVAARYRTVIGETVAYTDAKHPASSAGWEVVALPEGVIRRLRAAATE